MDDFVKHSYRKDNQEAGHMANLGGRVSCESFCGRLQNHGLQQQRRRYEAAGTKAKKGGGSGCGVVSKVDDREKWITVSNISVPLEIDTAMAAEVASAHIQTEVLDLVFGLKRMCGQNHDGRLLTLVDKVRDGCDCDDKDAVADESGTPLGRRRARAKPGGVCFRSLSFQATIRDPWFGVCFPHLRKEANSIGCLLSAQTNGSPRKSQLFNAQNAAFQLKRTRAGHHQPEPDNGGILLCHKAASYGGEREHSKCGGTLEACNSISQTGRVLT